MKLSKQKKQRLVLEILTRKYADGIEKVKQDISTMLENKIKEELKGVPWKACLSYIHTNQYARIEGKTLREGFKLSSRYPSKSSYSTSWVFKYGTDKKLDAKMEKLSGLYSQRDQSESD